MKKIRNITLINVCIEIIKRDALDTIFFKHYNTQSLVFVRTRTDLLPDHEVNMGKEENVKLSSFKCTALTFSTKLGVCKRELISKPFWAT